MVLGLNLYLNDALVPSLTPHALFSPNKVILTEMCKTHKVKIATAFRRIYLFRLQYLLGTPETEKRQ